MKTDFKEKNNAPFTLFCLLAAFCVIVTLAFTLPSFIKNEKKAEVLSTGSVAVAYNLKILPSGLFDGGKHPVEFTYLDDEAGEERTSKTPAVYTEVEAANLVFNKALTVYYKGDLAVQKGFDKKEANASARTGLVCGGVATLCFLGLGVYCKLRKKPSLDVQKNGQTAKGRIAEIVECDEKKGTFLVYLLYRNERGEECRGCVTRRYDREEISGYEVGQKVKLKYCGRNAVMLTEPTEREKKEN